MKRRSFHKSLGNVASVDHRFQREPLSLSQIRNCCDFTRQNQIQRGYQEFESANQRRNLRRPESYEPALSSRRRRSSIGNGTLTYRPATGVDMALGLNGFQGVKFPLPPRVPSTLSSLGSNDSRSNGRPKSSPLSRDRIASMMAQIRAKEDQDEIERKRLVREAEEQRIQRGNQELREEKSRQLNQAMPRDWEYQKNLKEQREVEASLHDKYDALDRNHRCEEEAQLEEAQRVEKERLLAEDKRQDLEEKEAHRLQHEMEAFRQDQREVFQYGQEQHQHQVDKEHVDEMNKETQLLLRQRQLDQMERRALKADHDAYNFRASEQAKNEQNSGVLEAERVFQETGKKKQLDEQHHYHEFLENSAQQKARERHLEDVHTSQEQRDLQTTNYNSLIAKQKERDVQRLGVNEFILGQIKEREKLAQANQMEHEREMQQRLKVEQEYVHAVQEGKERRQREQAAYRESLLAQIADREERRLASEREQKKFLEDRERSRNRENQEINRKLKRLNLLESHIHFDD